MKLKKLLAGFMTACMLITAVPVTAMAEKNAQPVSVAEIVGGGQYKSIQAAIDAADDGDTIKVIADIEDTPDADAWETLDGSFDTYAKVEGKTVTIDLNGKTITATYNGSRMLVGFFSTDNNGHLTLKDSVGGAILDVEAGTGTVYALLVNYEPGYSLIVDGGNYILDKAHDSLIYTGTDASDTPGEEGVFVNGGNFTLKNVGVGENGKPWIFNALDGNERNVIVNGGIFNADVNHQFWANEVFVPKEKALLKDNEVGTWTVVDAVAFVTETATSTGSSPRGVGYATIDEAIASANNRTITLLADGVITSGIVKGVIVPNSYKLTIKGGTFAPKDAEETEFYLKDYLCPDCTVAMVGGMWEVLPPVAQIGNTKYTSIQDAINDAAPGAEIKVIDDHNIAWKNFTSLSGITGKPSDTENALIYVNKKITLDLNGKTVTTAPAETDINKVVVIFVDDEGDLTLTDSSSGKTGKISAENGRKHIFALLMADGASALKVNGGNYYLDDCSGESMIYATNNETVTVTGGNFRLEKVDSRNNNGTPWIFNVSGRNDKHVVVHGGTFNDDIAHQYWRHEVQFDGTKAVRNNGNGTWTVVEAVAYVVEKHDGYDYLMGYETLAEAIEAADKQEGDNRTITLVKDCNLSAIIDKEVTINGNGNKIEGNVVISKDGSLEGNCEVKGNVIKVDDEDAVQIENGKIIITGPANVEIPGANGGTTEIKVPKNNRMVINPDGSVTVKEGNEIIIVEGEGEDTKETKVTVPEGVDSVTVPSEKLEDVKADANGNLTALPEGSKIEIGDTEITVGDGEGNDDTATINPETGEITLPEGSKIETEGTEIIVGDGEGNNEDSSKDTAIINPDSGEITLPEGSTIKDKENGEEVTLPNGGTVNNKGEVSTPKAEIGGATVTVPGGNVTVDTEGNVIVPAGGKIEQNDGTVIEPVTGGITVKPDGTVIVSPGGVVNVNGKPVTFPNGGTIGTDGTISEGIVSDTGSSSKKSSKKYEVSIDANDVDNGTVKLSPSKAKKGATVTITVTPDEGYKLDKLVVLDKDGNEVELTDKGDGKFTFKMPRGGVEVDASFVEAGAADKSEIVLTIDSVVAMVNGEPVVNDVAPIIKGERTFLPIRLIAEELGATVTWNEADQSVTIVKDDMTIVIYIGQAFALVDGSPVALDEPAFIVNSRTYLPLRFIAENLGAEVIWDGASQTVTVVGKA